mgnify:CR=1 FL=1
MQIGVRTLAAKLGLKGMQKLLSVRAIPAPVLSSKHAFKAPIGESNASLWSSRAALGKTMEKIAYNGAMGRECKNFPELTEYARCEYNNAVNEVQLSTSIPPLKIIGAADFVFTDNHGKTILSEYKISMDKYPTTTDYLQAIIYAMLYAKQYKKNIDIVEWFNPITGIQCRLLGPKDRLNNPDNIEKLVSVYTSHIIDLIKSG